MQAQRSIQRIQNQRISKHSRSHLVFIFSAKLVDVAQTNPKDRYLMFSSLRIRLIAICLSIVVLSMLTVVFANFISTRGHTLESVNQQTLLLAASQSAEIAEWVREKRTIVSSMGLA